MAAACERQCLDTIDGDRIASGHKDAVIRRIFGDLNGNATKRINELFETAEVDLGVIVDLDALNLVEQVDDGIVSTVFDG